MDDPRNHDPALSHGPGHGPDVAPAPSSSGRSGMPDPSSLPGSPEEPGLPDVPVGQLLSESSPSERAALVDRAVTLLEDAYGHADRTGEQLHTAAAHAATTTDEELAAARTAHVTAALREVAIAARRGEFLLAHHQPALADALARAAVSYCAEADGYTDPADPVTATDAPHQLA